MKSREVGKLNNILMCTRILRQNSIRTTYNTKLSEKMRVLKNADKLFILKCGVTLKIYLPVFDKKKQKNKQTTKQKKKKKKKKRSLYFYP